MNRVLKTAGETALAPFKIAGVMLFGISATVGGLLTAGLLQSAGLDPKMAHLAGYAVPAATLYILAEERGRSGNPISAMVSAALLPASFFFFNLPDRLAVAPMILAVLGGSRAMSMGWYVRRQKREAENAGTPAPNA